MGSVSGSTPLTVTAATLQSITIAPTTATIPVGVSQAFTATGTYSDSSVVDLTALVTWSVSNGNASISNAAGSNGTLTAVGAGAVSVTASLNAVSASVNATVVAAVLNQITVSPANVSLPLGLGQAFVATGLYSNGTVLDITSNVTWSNGDPAVATTSNVAGQAGYTHTIATGATTVVATLGAISGAANLTVTAPAVMSVTVSPSSSTLLIGLTRQFTATYSGNSGTATITLLGLF